MGDVHWEPKIKCQKIERRKTPLYLCYRHDVEEDTWEGGNREEANMCAMTDEGQNHETSRTHQHFHDTSTKSVMLIVSTQKKQGMINSLHAA